MSTKSRATAAKPSAPRFRFITDTIAELRKVVWLSRQEVIYLTTLVLVITAVVGVVLGVIDYGFSRLMGALFG